MPRLNVVEPAEAAGKNVVRFRLEAFMFGAMFMGLGGALTARLAALGARLLADTLPGIVDGSLTAAPQDEALATAAAKVLIVIAVLLCLNTL